MKPNVKTLIRKKIVPVFEIITYPFGWLCAKYMYLLRKLDFKYMPILKNLMFRNKVFPIIDHYNEPFFNPKYLNHSLRDDRELPGIDMNDIGQLELLSKFNFAEELRRIPEDEPSMGGYYYNNQAYKAGDGQYLYNIIRYFKPEHIIEIGSGYSTLMSLEAIKKNKEEIKGYHCTVECIEPFEMPWLEKTDAKIIRKRVEDIEISYFGKLKNNDILFIDSSHIIRPQGDVLIEYLRILPILNSGVMIHVHDIFTPKDYLDDWVLGTIKFWNEQYILEAYLSENNNYEIIGAVNYLKHHYYSRLIEKCPMLSDDNEPGAFWIRKK